MKIKKIKLYLQLIKNINKENFFFKLKKKMFKKKIFCILKEMKNPKKPQKLYMEIRACIGGAESCIFVENILNMYIKYLENNRIFYELFYIKKNYIGIKRIIIRIEGINIMNKFFFENGVHRIQRIPKTDKNKRIHTSTCVVEVYKEQKIKNVKFKRKDLKIETFKSSGAGGQHVNKTNSAVRIVHLPTGIKVECQKERSQIENRKFALKLLVSKIKKEEEKKQADNFSKKRKNYIKIFSTRCFKIRTYNFVRKIIIDHVIKKKFPLKEIFFNGNLNKIFKNNKLIK
ncbi:peptide chain release factor-like protein [Candidatus Vidania fulgoroideorum]